MKSQTGLEMPYQQTLRVFASVMLTISVALSDLVPQEEKGCGADGYRLLRTMLVSTEAWWNRRGS